VIRRRTEFLLIRARRRKHTIEGLLLALANIDEIINTIRKSRTQSEAKTKLMGIECPAAMMKQALGDEGFRVFQEERGESDVYTLTAVQSDAILKMTLGQLVNLEQEKLGEEHAKLLSEILDHLETLGDSKKILRIIKDELLEIRRKYADARRTQITGEEIGNIDVEDLIEEENMVVSISHRGYIKRTPVSVYRSQRRGGKGMKGAKTEEEDPIEHVFAASTHDFLLFFSNKGKVYWRKVYQLPQLRRDSRGRAIVNLLQLSEGEEIADCRAIRDFSAEDHYLMMATRKGLVKKTPLKAYGRPKRGGIIAIKLREDDEIINVVVATKGDDIILATAAGMAIRFDEADARPMGRNTSGVKGISLAEDDQVVGMVVVNPEATLLTVCENGYGKRTWFGNIDDASDEESSGTMRYRRQKRGGKGLRDIKTTQRNGKVIDICPVTDEDEILMMTSRGKLQRIACSDINPIGRNTQGVRIMTLDEADTLAAVVRVPPDVNDSDDDESNEMTPDDDQPEIDTLDDVADDMADEVVDDRGDDEGDDGDE
jgi:DNA gyrase subunit A